MEYSFYQFFGEFSIGCGIEYFDPNLHLSICPHDTYFPQKLYSLKKYLLDRKKERGDPGKIWVLKNHSKID
jgi:hypothetical protein